jgi:hypothetical protein
MIEYENGQFGSIAPAKDIIELLKGYAKDLKALEQVRAVHFGTPEGLQKIREGKVDYASIRADMDEMKRELETLKPKGAVKVFQLEDIPK